MARKTFRRRGRVSRHPANAAPCPRLRFQTEAARIGRRRKDTVRGTTSRHCRAPGKHDSFWILPVRHGGYSAVATDQAQKPTPLRTINPSDISSSRKVNLRGKAKIKVEVKAKCSRRIRLRLRMRSSTGVKTCEVEDKVKCGVQKHNAKVKSGILYVAIRNW